MCVKIVKKSGALLVKEKSQYLFKICFFKTDLMCPSITFEFKLHTMQILSLYKVSVHTKFYKILNKNYIVKKWKSMTFEDEVMHHFKKHVSLNNASFHRFFFYQNRFINECVRKNIAKIPLPRSHRATYFL